MLVVPKANVVVWLILLDEVALEHQCFEFRIGDQPIEIYDLRHHDQRLWGLRLSLLKIRTHPVTQRDRLTDVNDLSTLILHQIYARLIW